MEFLHGVTLHKDGTYAVGVSLDLGYLRPDDLIHLAALAEKYQVSVMNLTTAKKISFMDVKEEDVNPLWQDLAQTFGERLGFPKGKVIVCPGSRFCKTAVAGRDNHAIGHQIEAISRRHDAGKIKVGVSCCPLSCAMPGVRDIGILCTAKGWQLSVGGNAGAKPALGTVIASDLSDEALLHLVDRLYAYFTTNKNGKERAARMIQRLGLDHLKEYVLQ